MLKHWYQRIWPRQWFKRAKLDQLEYAEKNRHVLVTATAGYLRAMTELDRGRKLA